MKKLLITLTGALTIGAALPAIAGPDWQLIEQARKAKVERMQQVAAQQAPTSGSGASRISQPVDKDANQEKMMKECAEMMKKP
ncbi:MAG: hypothetical protein A3K04_02295 [Gallionellales bacterium RBG_16_56_9]|nr:MAG: hypothetical protein A3K04_02295 [Gallionellales bacterium RBG_16_56_9]